MKNPMQKVYLNLEQSDATKLVRAFGSNKKNGERGTAYFTLRTEVVRKSDNSHLSKWTARKATRTVLINDSNNGIVDLIHTKNAIIEDYVTPQALADLKAKGWENIWSDQSILKLAKAENYKIECYGHIAQQEFALEIQRLKKGKVSEYLKSYENCLARYADSEHFTVSFEDNLRGAISGAEKKLKINLLKDTEKSKAKLRSPETGKFNFSLVHALTPEQQLVVAQALEVFIFGSDKTRAKVKKVSNDKNAPFLLEKGTGAYIIAYTFYCTTEEQIESTSDISVEVDNEDASLVTFRASQNAQRNTASSLDALAEETSEELETADAVLEGTEE
jgi:hypothetical protein